MATNTQTNKKENVFETEIPLTSIDHIELDWHTDGKTRFMQVLEGVGWKFQFKDEPAREVGPGTSIHINKNSIHKLIKGSTDLKVRIVEL
jgi:quercetin dioxygenase-like cupin family protein